MIVSEAFFIELNICRENPSLLRKSRIVTGLVFSEIIYSITLCMTGVFYLPF
jgi:hypothetical protein